jgi:hypothetical protein
MGVDNSFEQEVEPIQRQLENRFHPMEGVHPPPGMQGINGLGSEGFIGMQQMPMPSLNPINPMQQLMQMQEELAPLNYLKIKQYLVESNEEIRVCATLQALRWRLTKTKRKQLVKLVIHAYQHYDLLDCKKAARAAVEDDPASILIEGLLTGPRKVLEYTMTFVNALASECLGRSYLL